MKYKYFIPIIIGFFVPYVSNAKIECNKKALKKCEKKWNQKRKKWEHSLSQLKKRRKILPEQINECEKTLIKLKEKREKLINHQGELKNEIKHSEKMHEQFGIRVKRIKSQRKLYLEKADVIEKSLKPSIQMLRFSQSHPFHHSENIAFLIDQQQSIHRKSLSQNPRWYQLKSLLEASALNAFYGKVSKVLKENQTKKAVQSIYFQSDLWTPLTDFIIRYGLSIPESLEDFSIKKGINRLNHAWQNIEKEVKEKKTQFQNKLDALDTKLDEVHEALVKNHKKSKEKGVYCYNLKRDFNYRLEDKINHCRSKKHKAKREYKHCREKHCRHVPFDHHHPEPQL